MKIKWAWLNKMATQIQIEEMESLEAIFSDDFSKLDSTSFSISVKPSTDLEEAEKFLAEGCFDCLLQFNLPINYPEEVSPVFQIRCAQLNGGEITELADSFQSSFILGEVIIFQWVEMTRDFISVKFEEYMKSQIKETVEHSFSSETPTSPCREEEEKVTSETVKPNIPFTHGQPLTDRKSTFQAHMTQVHNIHEVRTALSELKENRKINSATHNIVAYRFIDISKGGALIQDSDDDGESGAGSRLLHLMIIMNVLDTMVVVTRWYGGIQLGPDRFKHINNVARILLQELDKSSQTERRKKRLKNN